MPYVLVVDDNADARELLCAYLRRLGYAVDYADSGNAAIHSVTERLPDALVLDLFMPEMDGIEVLKLLRSYVRLHDLPVVIWTAYPNSPLVQRARDLGVEDVVTKGRADLSEIKSALAHLIWPGSAVVGADGDQSLPHAART
jgi:CheY-like chemotaxis protein